MIDRGIINHVRLNQPIRHCECGLPPTLSLVLERKHAEEERRREQQRHRAAAKAAAHAKRLDDLAAEGDAPWKRVDEMISAKKTSEYDLVVSLLRDLREVGERQDQAEQFSKRVLGIRERYWNRPALHERLDKAKMPRAAGGNR